MDAGEVFRLAVRSCNVLKQTGGEYIEFATAVKHQQLFNQYSTAAKETGYKRNPNHYGNSTRNIRVLPEGNIVTVHLRLMMRFNSKIII